MIKSISLPNIQRSFNTDYSSFHDQSNKPLHNSSSSLAHTKSSSYCVNLELPIQNYIEHADSINYNYLLSSNGKYLISYSTHPIVNKIYIFNTKKHTTEFNSSYPNYQAIAVNKNGDYILCGRIFYNKIRDIQSIQKVKKNINSDQIWRPDIQRYSAVPAADINSITINNNKAIIANYTQNKLNIWHEGPRVKQKFLGNLFSRKIATWKPALPITTDSIISKIKFDTTDCNRLFVITKNKTLKIFYHNINNTNKWEEKHSIDNCIHFPDNININGDILLFFKDKSLTIKRYCTEKNWQTDNIVLDEIITAVVFLPNQATGLLIYSKNNMYKCQLTHNKWLVSKQLTPLKHSVLTVLASSNNNSNTIIYNPKQEQHSESICTIL
jgi:hypothetical protein